MPIFLGIPEPTAVGSGAISRHQESLVPAAHWALVFFAFSITRGGVEVYYSPITYPQAFKDKKGNGEGSHGENVWHFHAWKLHCQHVIPKYRVKLGEKIEGKKPSVWINPPWDCFEFC